MIINNFYFNWGGCVISSNGWFQILFTLKNILYQDLEDFTDYCRGELNSPSHDTDTFPYCRNNFTRRDDARIIFSPTGFNVIFPAIINVDLHKIPKFLFLWIVHLLYSHYSLCYKTIFLLFLPFIYIHKNNYHN